MFLFHVSLSISVPYLWTAFLPSKHQYCAFGKLYVSKVARSEFVTVLVTVLWSRPLVKALNSSRRKIATDFSVCHGLALVR